MEYEEELKEARETGEGVATKFQENTNYTMAGGNGFDCPHCGAYHGYKLGKDNKVISEITAEKVSQPYELPTDIEWMCKHTGYSWHEDCKCGNCNQMYTQNNGC